MVAFDPPSASAVHDATRSLPIVSALLTDPVGMRLVASYAHPGGDLTGMVVAVEGLSTKQVGLATELIPGITALGVLINPTNTTSGRQRQEIETAATANSIRVVGADVRTESELNRGYSDAELMAEIARLANELQVNVTLTIEPSKEDK